MQYIRFNNSSGGQIGSIASATGQTLVAYNTTSDYRLKENLQSTSTLNKVITTPVYELNFIDDFDKTKVTSMLAHEVQESFPWVVTGEKDAIGENDELIPQQVDYSKLVPVLWRAIQELNEEISILKNRIEVLTTNG